MNRKIIIIAILLFCTVSLFAKQYVFEGKAINADKAKNEKVRELVDEGYSIVQATSKGFKYTIVYEDTLKTTVKNIKESEDLKKLTDAAKDIGGKLWEGTKEIGKELSEKTKEIVNELKDD